MAEVAARDEEALVEEAQIVPLAAGAGWMATTFDAFRYPVYRTLWLGTVLSFLAFNISATAQGVVAYDLTGSNGAVGLVMFGQGLAMLILNPFGGAVADRFSKRFLILFAQVVIGGVMLAMAVLIATDRIQIIFLALGAFTVGCMFSFLGPTRTALLAEVVPEDKTGNALALIQVGGNFSRIAGPALGGLLLSIAFIGSAGTYFIIAAIFIFVIATLYQIPKPKGPMVKPETSVLSDVIGGFRYVREHARVLQTLVSYHLVTVLGLSYFVILPGFTKEALNQGTAGYGILLAATALGGLITSIVVAGMAESPRVPAILAISSAVLALTLVMTGLAPNFPMAIVALFLVGAGASAFQTLNNVMAVRYTDSDFLGRVIGLMFLAWGLNSLFSLPVGTLADVFGERAVLVGAGVILAVVTVLSTFWERRIAASETPLTVNETIVRIP